MDGREYQRIPYSVQVQFRTATSFLVAYSVNLSRGGIFLETTNVAPMGTELSLQFAVPGTGPLLITGRVTWSRSEAAVDGPAGMGVEFNDVDDTIGAVIDRLVAEFAGLNIMLLARDSRDRSTLSRIIKSIIDSAEVVGAADAHIAQSLLGEDIDLAVVVLDDGSEDCLLAIQKIKASTTRVPVIALASSRELRVQAERCGADEVSSNPPPSAEFQRILVRAIGKPSTIRNG